MRELIGRVGRGREERGVAAVFFGLAITIILAAIGMSLDVGNSLYMDNKIQDTADSAAKQIAYNCAKAPTSTACTASTDQARSVASGSMGSDADGASISASSTGASGVKVTITKNLATPLLGYVGVNTKAVGGSATATWNNYPISGTPVLPLGVSYCTWKNSGGLALAAGTSTNGTKVSLRTDTLQSLRNMMAPLLGTLAVFRLDSIMTMLGTSLTDSCSDVDGRQLLTFKGALWLTGEHVVRSLLSGTFSDNGVCQVRIGSDLDTFLGGMESGLFIPTACAAKFGPGKEVAVGKTILLPIYKPASSAGSTLGLKVSASACAGAFGTAQGTLTCVEVPPKIGVDIVGYAPFVVTGWQFPNTPSGYNDASVGCSTAPLNPLNPKALVQSSFTFLEQLLNTVSSLLSSLTGIGQLTMSLNCNGLQGYFTKSMVKDPKFTYGPGGTNLGAGAVKLTN